MATAGPRYPGTIATEQGPSGDNDWTNAANIGADDGSEAQITAATYDANDHSYRLKATNFGFDADIPAGSTINGITVEIEQRRFAGAAEDQEVRLYDSTATLVGDDKQTATAWPATATIATYGGSADLWNAGFDDADIRSSGFGVAHIVLATAANTDIGVDFIRVTIDYTAPAVTEKQGADSGSGAEISAEQATHGRAESGAGAEATAETAAHARTETGSGTEATAETGAYTVTDAGVGSDAGLSVFPQTATEAGAGAETSTVTGAYARAEGGAGVDASAETASYSRADAGSGVESAAAAAAHTLTDAGVGADAGRSTFTQTASDAATGTETAIETAALTRADAGTGAETASEAVTLTRSDLAAAAELAGLMVGYVLTDGGTGTESATVTQLTQIQVADAGTGADLAALAAALLAMEAAGGSDSATATGDAPVVVPPDLGSPLRVSDLPASARVQHTWWGERHQRDVDD